MRVGREPDVAKRTEPERTKVDALVLLGTSDEDHRAAAPADAGAQGDRDNVQDLIDRLVAERGREGDRGERGVAESEVYVVPARERADGFARRRVVELEPTGGPRTDVFDSAIDGGLAGWRHRGRVASGERDRRRVRCRDRGDRDLAFVDGDADRAVFGIRADVEPRAEIRRDGAPGMYDERRTGIVD